MPAAEPLPDYLARFTTADQVADACRAAGVKAEPGDCNNCALAKLLAAKGYSQPLVDYNRLDGHDDYPLQATERFGNRFSWTSPATFGPSVSCNPAVTEFVKAFDNGDYPDLT